MSVFPDYTFTDKLGDELTLYTYGEDSLKGEVLALEFMSEPAEDKAGQILATHFEGDDESHLLAAEHLALTIAQWVASRRASEPELPAYGSKNYAVQVVSVMEFETTGKSRREVRVRIENQRHLLTGVVGATVLPSKVRFLSPAELAKRDAA